MASSTDKQNEAVQPGVSAEVEQGVDVLVEALRSGFCCCDLLRGHICGIHPLLSEVTRRLERAEAAESRLRTAREDALEEAAKIADTYLTNHSDFPLQALRGIARAIRSLKERQ